MGPALLQQGMAVYSVDLEKLCELRPDVILTQLQVRARELPARPCRLGCCALRCERIRRRGPAPAAAAALRSSTCARAPCAQDQGGRIEHRQFEAALQALLGYAPRVVHLAAACLSEVWQDMQKVADAVGKGGEGRRLVQELQQRMQAASTACRGRAQLRVACVQWPVRLPPAAAPYLAAAGCCWRPAAPAPCAR
jgi:hypothetical protein